METQRDELAALAQQALAKIGALKKELAGMKALQGEPVAVVGMGCRFPAGADTPAAFWQHLIAGRDTAAPVPPDRWDNARYFHADPGEAGKIYVDKGCFIDDVAGFDADFFAVTPREARGMDPQQRILLECLWHTFESAGIAADQWREKRVGIYLGQMNQDYLHREGAPAPELIDYAAALGNTYGVSSGRLAWLLGLQGPALTVDTACSSSLVALHLACQAIRAGECELAIAAGVNLQLSPLTTQLECSMRMLAPDGRCKTFDATADGFVRGDGCGVLLLRPLAAARQAGDTVLGLIHGSAVNHNGVSSGLTVPNGVAQRAVIAEALARSGIEPHQVDYVEAHGTGTQLGDPIELESLGQVFRHRQDAAPLRIGSVKTNIGHTEGAAGIAGVIKTLLALQHETVPPHLHYTHPTPHFPWATSPLSVPVSAEPWPRGARRRLAGVSSFGLSGTNAHVVLGEAPAETEEAAACDWPAQLFVLSAKTPEALAALQARYLAELPAMTASLAEICHTAATGRSHFPWRTTVVAADKAALMAGLTGAPAEKVRRDGVFPAWLCPARPEPAAAGALYRYYPVCRAALDECARHLEPLGIADLAGLLWGGDAAEKRRQPRYAYPAQLALTYAAGMLWRSWGMSPAAVMGSGPGEYAAACLAGVFSLEAALRLACAAGEAASAGAAQARFAAVAGAIRYAAPACLYVSAVAGVVRNEDIVTPDYWLAQLNAGTEEQPGRAALEENGVTHFLPLDGQDPLRMLGTLWRAGAQIAWGDFYRPYRVRRAPLPLYPFAHRRYWLETPQAAVRSETETHAVPPPPFILQLRATPPGQQRAALRRFLIEQAAQALGWDSADLLGGQDKLFELGMNSIIALELTKHLETALGCGLPATTLFDHPTPDALTDFLLTQCAPQMAQEGGELTLEAIAAMSEDEAGRRLQALLDSADYRSPVL